MTSHDIRRRAIKKAFQSDCRYKISALGFNNRGELIYTATNQKRFYYRGGGIHAEMRVMLKAGPALKTVVICRVNKRGDLLPIEPCPVCQKKAEELGVRIVSIEN
jgi:cytidine deaminase